MYFLFFLAIAVILTIPTFGVSLLAFFIAKNWFDNQAMNSLLGAAVEAMREEVSQERYHINRAAICKVFSRFSDRPPEVYVSVCGGATLYWGVVRHPMINENKPFSVRFGYTPRRGTGNTVFVKAAHGIDKEVLSAEDLNSLSLFPAFVNVADKNIHRANPKSDDDIKSLIVRIAASGKSKCKILKLRYGSIDGFVDKYSNGTEYFANYKGLRFWVDIGDSEYAVYVENLEPSRKDAGPVAISASLAGPAQRFLI